MARYVVVIARSARKELEELPNPTADRILARIESLSDDPRPAGCAKLRGSTKLWRIRVGDYRVVYSVEDRTHTVDVSIIRHRRDVYREL